MKNLLLDTSVLIDFLRKKDRASHILSLEVQKGTNLYISIVTHTELFSGKSIWHNENDKEKLEKLLTNLSIIPIELKISLTAGKIRATTDIATIDAIIAATALKENLPLATLNVKDFKKVKGLRLLS